MVATVRSSRQTAEASIENLAARIYADHTGLAEEIAELIASAEAAGDRRTADLGRLLRADVDNRAGLVPQGVAEASYLNDDLESAAALMERMRACSFATGEPLNASCADTVARILLETGHPGPALVVVEQAIDGAAPTDSDAIPTALHTLAEIQHRSGDTPAALITLARCREMADRDNRADAAASALRMQADCHAALGDFEAAYREMVDSTNCERSAARNAAK
jgi:tetratricopeptide (TPR) repeat protein